jgi:alpha-glucosidase
MVRHYRHVIERRRICIMLDVHEPMHDTGERRSWPDMMSREGAREQEYNAWSGDGGNPPEHETILPVTFTCRAVSSTTGLRLRLARGRPGHPDPAGAMITLAGSRRR